MPRLKGVKSNKIKDNKNKDEKNELLKHSLYFFFEEHKQYIPFIKAVSDKKYNHIFLEWFINTYAKKTALVVDNKLVYNSFKKFNKSYSKKFFDIKAKGCKITLTFDDKKIDTSVSQLNFLKWLCVDGISKYIQENYEELQTLKETLKKEE